METCPTCAYWEQTVQEATQALGADADEGAPEPPMREFHRALLAYDGNAAAHRVLETLARLAVALNLEVIAAHLFEPGKDKTCLARAGEYLQRHSVRYETVYLEGDSHIALLRLAGERECDLLASCATPAFVCRRASLDPETSLGRCRRIMFGHAKGHPSNAQEKHSSYDSSLFFTRPR